MLKRTELRQMAVNLLLNITAAKERVYDSNPFPIDAESCPCILIYTPQDNASSAAGHTALLKCSLTLAIEVRVAEEFGFGAKLVDEIAEQVEDILIGSYEFQNSIEGLTSINTQIGHEDGGELPFSIAILSITVEYKREILPRPDGYYLAATINTDAIDPADPNEASPGPDGRIEATMDILVPQN